MIKFIQCKTCEGHYVIRNGKYGVFAGCSHYPVCKSTLNIPELVYEFIRKYGINIYQWQKQCWKCQQETLVYSYYLYYDLSELDPFFSAFHGIGVGDISSIDHLLSLNVPTVKTKYSQTLNKYYMANVCQYCGVIQGHYYVVTDPHEIIDSLWHLHEMNNYFFKNLKIDEYTVLSELKDCIDRS